MNNDNLIPAIPALPPEIFIAHMQEKLAIFTGAGVSRLVGCKSWVDLASNLLHICREKKLINNYEEETINKLPDNKRKITIAKKLLDNNGLKDEFYNCFLESLTFDPDISNPFYADIKKLGNIFITTNADKCFENIISDNYTKKDWNYSSVEPEKNHLYHIHGNQDNYDSLVFTAAEYLRRYTDKSFMQFLNKIFEDYTVLFIGYSLSEFELLDYIMKNAPLRKNEIPDHYILQAYNSFEKKISDCDALYYKELNVTLIPFSKDENGYKQLIEIISNWSKEISNIIDTNVNKIEVFDKLILVNPFGELEARKILDLIEIENNDDPLLYRLINQCHTNPFLAHFFVLQLNDRKAYNAENNPEPEPKGDNLYSIRKWNILDIAEICLDEAIKNNNKADIDLIKSIIDGIITNNKIDNYHTFEWLIRNIFKLPEQDISINYIKFIEITLDSKFNTLLQSQALEKAFSKKIMFYQNTNLVFSIFEKLLSLCQINFRTCTKMDLYYFNMLINNSYKNLAKKDSIQFIKIIEKTLNTIPITSYEYMVTDCYYNPNNILETNDMEGVQTIVNLYLWLLKQKSDMEDYIYSKIKGTDFVGGVCNRLIKNDFCNPQYSHINNNSKYFLSEVSRIRKNMFSNCKIDEVIGYIQNKKSEKHDFIKQQSFLSSFHLWLIENFTSVIDNIIAFFSLNIFWQDQILIAANQLIVEHKAFDYEKLLPLIENQIYEESPIWKLKGKEYPSSNELKFIQSSSEFIFKYAANIRMDKQIYERFHEIAKMIFSHRKYIFENNNPYEFEYTTRFRNSESGRICKALFVLNNVYYNMNKSIDNDFWDILNNEIHKEKKDELFIYSIGVYLSYLYEQNKKWVDEQITNLFIEPFCDGLFNNTYLNEELYLYLLGKSFFKYVINNFYNKPWITQMVNYGCRSIIQGFEQIADDSCLLRQIIIKLQPSIVDSIINFFRQNSDKQIPQELINELWKYLFIAINPLSDKNDYKNVLQELIYFLDYIDKIDDKNYQYLELSCSFLTQYKMDGYLIPRFLELYKKDDGNKAYIEKLFLLITKNGVYFFDYKDCVTNLLKEISKNNISLAREICDKYYSFSGFDKYSDLVKEFKKIEIGQNK